MAENTEFLNLYKWDKKDKKIDTINGITANTEKIDSKLKEHNEHLNSVDTSLTNHNTRLQATETQLSDIEPTIQSAVVAAENANTKAGQVEAVISSANTAIQTANDAATVAQQKATLAETNATEALTQASNANEKAGLANQAITNANTAIANAETATDNANTAADTANAATETIQNAVDTANAANTKATNAETSATNAVNSASTANTTANSALTTANEAKTSATNAVNTANSAFSTASTANATASGANSNASSALTASNTANATAGAASTAANEAKTTANTALTTANTAKTTADDVRTEFDQVVAEAGINNPEVVNARGTHAILKDRLDSTDAQLAQNVQQISDLETNKADNSRVDNIVAQAGTDNTEIVDARNSTVKGITYTVLDNRLEDIETDFNKIKKTFKKIKVDTPAWTNQPTVDLVNNCFVLPGLDTGNSGILSQNKQVDFMSAGTLPTGFVDYTKNYYFVNVVDAATGKFQLMETYNTPATVISLTDTGSGWSMRDDSVNKISYVPQNKLCDYEITANLQFGKESGSFFGQMIKPFNTVNFVILNSLFGWNFLGDVGYVFDIHDTNSKFNIINLQQKITRIGHSIINNARFSRTGVNSTTVSGGSGMITKDASFIGRLLSKNPQLYPIENVQITEITIIDRYVGLNTIQYIRNGSEILISEIERGMELL